MSLNSSPDSGLEKSQYEDFVAFTSTFYKDDVEGRVRSAAFFEMIENAQKIGIRVVVVDGGSGGDFRDRVSEYPNVTLIDSRKGGENIDRTMAGDRRFSGKKAIDIFPMASYFLWLEPEKAELIKEKNIDAILSPLRDGTADIVVPSRISKETLPAQQRAVENRANKRAVGIVRDGNMNTNTKFKLDNRKLTSDSGEEQYVDMRYSDTSNNPGDESFNAPLDLWFGPKAFNRKSLEEDFLTYKGAKWDGIITSVLAGKQRGKSVLDVPVDFSYPTEQTQLESGEEAQKNQEKRRIQYRYIIKTIRDMVRLQSSPESIMSSVQKHIQSQNFDALIRLTNSFSLTHGHQDSRRLIEEYNGANFSVQRFTVKDGSAGLGHHYHLKGDQNLSEVFIIEQGGGRLLLQNIDSSGKPSSEIQEKEVKKGDIIVIPPNQAHTFYLESDSIMRGFRPYPFDPDNMDMNSHRLELPLS